MFKTNLDALKTIIKDNKETEYGKKYNFSQINSYEEYKNNVPITNYSKLKPYIDRIYNGEENVLTSYKIHNFNCTSGTEGECKKIPFTIKALDVCYDIPERKKNNIIREYRKKNGKGKRLFIGLYSIDIENPEKNKNLFLSEAYSYYLYKKGIMDYDEYIGGKDLLFDSYTKDYIYEKIWCAILEENIILIESVYIYEILLFFNIFEKYYKEIISDIRNNKINPEKKISEKAKTILLNMEYSEERLNFVEKECDKGFEGIARRIWKNIKLISGISNKLYVYENKALDKYIGDIPKDGYVYAMSEGAIGTSFENNYIYHLEPNFEFHEFIPYSKDGKNQSNDIFNINEIEKNKIWEIILTNFSGLYRYEIGDVIKVVNINEKGIFFEFCFRKNNVINIIAEKTNFYHLEKVMRRMDEIIPNILAYSIGATIYENIGTYFLFLSLDDDQLKNINLNTLIKEFDLALCKVNFGYGVDRKKKYLGEPKVFVMNKEKYNKLMNINSNKTTQIKQKYILNEKFLNEILEKMEKI